jgi:hypothetical protein
MFLCVFFCVDEADALLIVDSQMWALMANVKNISVHKLINATQPLSLIIVMRDEDDDVDDDSDEGESYNDVRS